MPASYPYSGSGNREPLPPAGSAERMEFSRQAAS